VETSKTKNERCEQAEARLFFLAGDPGDTVLANDGLKVPCAPK